MKQGGMSFSLAWSKARDKNPELWDAWETAAKGEEKSAERRTPWDEIPPPKPVHVLPCHRTI